MYTSTHTRSITPLNTHPQHTHAPKRLQAQKQSHGDQHRVRGLSQQRVAGAGRRHVGGLCKQAIRTGALLFLVPTHTPLNPTHTLTHKNPQRIEKLMSGLYLGEVVRRLLVRLVEKHALLGRNILHHGLHDAIHKLTTAHVAEIHGDTTPTLATTRRIVFEVFGIVSMSTQACRLVQQLCELACIRSARLLATCIAALLREIGRDGVDSPRTVIGIDGSMYEKYPQFKIEVARALDELLGTEVAGKTVLKLTRDGSSLGAAALAAAAVREVPLTDKERAKLRTLSKKRTFKS